MHVKICSSICNHKSLDTAAVVGCRLWYAVVCPGGNCAVDKCHQKTVEEAGVKEVLLSSALPELGADHY